MPTGFTYASYQAAIVTQIPSLPTDPNFATMLPDAIDYAELSICRDLDLLQMHGDIALGAATIGTATYAVPGAVIVLEALYYGPNTIPVAPASQEFIRAVFAGAANGPPENFAVIGAASGAGWSPAAQVLLGPAPDATYTLTGYGTERPATLSETNTTTFISLNLPDLFWAASMIFWSGYTKNFGAMTDNPQMPISWQSEYTRLLKGAGVENARDKFQSQGWQAEAPSPVATPQRV